MNDNYIELGNDSTSRKSERQVRSIDEEISGLYWSSDPLHPSFAEKYLPASAPIDASHASPNDVKNERGRH